VSVSAHGSDPVGAGLACLANVNLALPGDLAVSLNVNWLSPVKVRRMMIGGSRRTIVWDDLNPAMRIAVYDRGVDKLATVEDRTRRNVSYRIGDVIAPALPEREALVEVFSTFARGIVDGAEVPTDGEAGLRVLQVLEAASTSLAEGGHKIDMPQNKPNGEGLEHLLRGAIPEQPRRRPTRARKHNMSGAA
jgi:predicted dehydrogenase